MRAPRALLMLAVFSVSAPLLDCSDEVSSPSSVPDGSPTEGGNVDASTVDVGHTPSDGALVDAQGETDAPVVVPGVANLWIDGSGGTCTRSATPSSYADGAACASLAAAYTACSPGDVIVIKSGTYGPESISGAKAAPGCTIVGEEGTAIGALSTGGSHMTLKNVTIDVGNGHAPGGWGNSASDVLLERVKLHGAYASVFIGGGSNVTWRGGELGVAGAIGGKRSCNSSDSEPVQVQSADHVLFDGVAFHPQDFDATACPSSVNGFHLEMVRIDVGADFVTVRNSTFDDGDHSNTSSIFITNVSGDPGDPKHLVFENNDFGTADNSTFSVHQNVADCSTFVFAYNTFHQSPGDPTSNGCSTSTGMAWIGNLGPRPSYYACAGTHTKNLWQDSLNYSCGTDSVVIGTRFATEKLGLGGASGFQLQAGSPAIDQGEAAGYCATLLRDHDGDTRPTGTACDVGADER